MNLRAGINRARQLANLKDARDYEFYYNVVNWLEELAEFKKHAKDNKAFHGMSDTRIYHIWAMMKSRCNNAANENYKYYGGRGIKVCEAWNGDNGFWNFYNWAIRHGYKENLSIDRIDANGDYSPDNCRWATALEQANNKRNSEKGRYTYKNTTLTLREWSERVGISYFTLRNRLAKGWTIESTLETPLDQKKSNGKAGRKKK